MSGLVPHNLRLPADNDDSISSYDDMDVVVDDNKPQDDVDENGNVMQINHEDGSISINIDGSPIRSVEEDLEKKKKWFRNLVEDISENDLQSISSDLLRGIENDKQSRIDYCNDIAEGIKLLGLKLSIPNVEGTGEGAPVEGQSQVRHPLLLEAVLRFQANARSELLPTDGPVKVRVDDVDSDVQEDRIANALEKGLNHYLTTVASEYYPDTDRMLFNLGLSGCCFKKVYFCPIRKRPVSERIESDNLIVNNSATDLKNAKRITHIISMRKSDIKRMQILGVYRDVDLFDAPYRTLTPVEEEKNAQQGVNVITNDLEDNDRVIYECHCELNIPGFEHRFKGKETGLEVPYIVTIDVATREILSIVRNYDRNTEDLPVSRTNFVKYPFVPGLGFYDIGLLHILGNTTNAVTAAWRILLDSGMYANFPGFLMADEGGRQDSNIFRVPPGGAALVRTNGKRLQDAIMPLPYSAQGAPSLMNLVNNVVETGQRVGGTSELPVGEGRADAPVGTTLALIEQATKVLNAVHKRLHAAQAEEFKLLVNCFKEHPECFRLLSKKQTPEWNENNFVQWLDQYEIVPQADPNTSSQTQRLMKVIALKQLQSQNPSMYDPIAIDTAAIRAIGWSNPEQFLAPQSAQANPPPELLQAQAKVQTDMAKANAMTMDAQTRQMIAASKAQFDEAKLQIEAIKAQGQLQKDMEDTGSKAADRASKERIQLIDLAQNIAVHPYSAELVAPLVEPTLQEIQDQDRLAIESGVNP